MDFQVDHHGNLTNVEGFVPKIVEWLAEKHNFTSVFTPFFVSVFIDRIEFIDLLFKFLVIGTSSLPMMLGE